MDWLLGFYDWLLGFYNYRIVIQYLPEFGRGLWATIWISAIAMVMALSLGTVVAIMRMSANPFVWRIAAGYVQAIRSTPLLVQIYVIYFALPPLPLLGRRLDELEGGILALGLNAGAFMSEIIRAGIQSIEKGQVEGAMSVGMTYIQRLRHVVLPQAISPGHSAAAGSDGGPDQGQFPGQFHRRLRVVRGRAVRLLRTPEAQ